MNAKQTFVLIVGQFAFRASEHVCTTWALKSVVRHGNEVSKRHTHQGCLPNDDVEMIRGATDRQQHEGRAEFKEEKRTGGGW